MYTKDSLEKLKAKVDLAEVIGSFIELKKQGGAFKALCPFHDEKTPSFTLQKGDTHYHCFGCQAHGDAIAFLMNFNQYSFQEAVEYLAEKFHVALEKAEKEENTGPPKKALRDALESASKFYQTLLHHTEEGHQAIEYLNRRSLSLDFIKKFELGLAPSVPGVLSKTLHALGFKQDILEAAGLVQGRRDFFLSRILFPIRSPSGFVIGFSGRKYLENTHGGKYINTPETPLFKKSRVLFGLNYSRQKIAKIRQAIIVEGQIDALKLIYEGFDFTVASQGTAFGEEHAKELIHLGPQTIFLAFDSDKAGKTAAVKVGNFFQKEGIDVKVVSLPEGEDPDSFLKKQGREAFASLLSNAESYLDFLVREKAREIDSSTPAGKNELALLISKMIREWNHPLMVHESLKKLAAILHVPESLIGTSAPPIPNLYLKKNALAGGFEIDPDWILETDILRFIFLVGPNSKTLRTLAKEHLSENAFQISICKTAFQIFIRNDTHDTPMSLIDLSCELDHTEGQRLLDALTEKKIQLEKGEKGFHEALKRLLDRNWLQEREAIRIKIQSGTASEEEALALAKAFEEIKRRQPKVVS